MKNGFLKDSKSDFNIFKNNFPENTLIYINQVPLTIKKEPTIYSSYFILGQIISLLNPPQDLNDYVHKQSEVKILVPLYDISNGNFKGIKQTLAHIMLRGDKDETFFTYGFSKELSIILVLNNRCQKFLQVQPLKAIF